MMMFMYSLNRVNRRQIDVILCRVLFTTIRKHRQQKKNDTLCNMFDILIDNYRFIQSINVYY